LLPKAGFPGNQRNSIHPFKQHLPGAGIVCLAGQGVEMEADPVTVKAGGFKGGVVKKQQGVPTGDHGFQGAAKGWFYPSVDKAEQRTLAAVRWSVKYDLCVYFTF